MTITALESRIERIESLCPRLYADHHRCLFVSLRHQRWDLLVKIREARQRAGWGCTQNASLPPGGGSSEKFVQLAR